MKTTSNWCFGTSLTSCAMALDEWQCANCKRCTKARFFNAKTGRMPKYVCAIQEQIERQASGEMQDVNVRTFEAVHGKQECQYISHVECEPVSENNVIDAHEFARGKQIDVPVEETQHVQEQNVKEINVHDAEKMYQEKRELEFKEQAKREAEELRKNFTWSEHLNISYFPLVMQMVVWHYALRAKQAAADARLDATKKLSRNITELHGQWIDTLRRDLDAMHVKQLETSANIWEQDTGNDQTILFMQARQAYLKQYPNEPNIDIRSFASCAILFGQFILDYQKKMDELVSERLGTQIVPIKWPHLTAVMDLMHGFTQGCDIERTKNIDMCMRVMSNKMRQIKWIENAG